MNARTAESYLPCYRPGKKADATIAKAARFAEGDERLRVVLQEQERFDAQMVGAIQSIVPPENLQQRLRAKRDEAAPKLGKLAAHPAILCAIAGILLIVGVLVYQELERRAGFPGKENAERMVGMLDEMSGTELEPTQGAAGGLGDWFYMRGFEGFALPPELAALPTVGARTFKLDGQLVSQLAMERQESILYFFRASDFGVRLDEAADWNIFEQDAWAVAIRQRQGMVTLLTFRGNRAEMASFVASLQP